MKIFSVEWLIGAFIALLLGIIVYFVPVFKNIYEEIHFAHDMGWIWLGIIVFLFLLINCIIWAIRTLKKK